MGRFTSYGGGRHHTAIIGQCPEHRDWTPDMPMYEPEIAASVRIEALVTVDSGMKAATYIGPRSYLLKKCHVGHDAQIGADCEIAVGAIVGGHCVIGKGAKIGLGAIVLPGVRVGVRAHVGAGAVVTKDIPDGEVWAGVPARVLPRSGFHTDGQTVARLVGPSRPVPSGVPHVSPSGVIGE